MLVRPPKVRAWDTPSGRQKDVRESGRHCPTRLGTPSWKGLSEKQLQMKFWGHEVNPIKFIGNPQKC